MIACYPTFQPLAIEPNDGPSLRWDDLEKISVVG